MEKNFRPLEQMARDFRLKHQVRRATRDREQVDPKRNGFHSRGYLPHVKMEHAAYFVTFRTADSLPKEVYERLSAKRAERERRAQAMGDKERREEACDEAAREFQRAIERQLDACLGECHLRRPECAKVVEDALKFFHGARYDLKSWVVMPNHVHALLWPKSPHTLSEILKSWKGFTARKINEVIGKTGERFWQPESFDRWLRDSGEEPGYRDYIENNPVKAKLCAKTGDWPWSSAARK